MASFLDLSLEIREQVYQHLLLHQPADPDSSSQHSKEQPLVTRPGHPTLHPMILSVCKQTHAEALPILYAQNTFRAHPTLLTSFPSLHSPRAYPPISESSCPGVRLIRKWYLTARLDCGPFWTARTVAEAFTGADELMVEVWQSMYDGAGSEVLRLFEGVRGVKRAKIWGSIAGREGYVRLLEGLMRGPADGHAVPLPQGGRSQDGEGE
ncbi:unnamed protein product [Discula destructiva]